MATSFAVATGGARAAAAASTPIPRTQRCQSKSMSGGRAAIVVQQRAVTMTAASRRRSLVTRAASEGGEERGSGAKGEEEIGAGLKAVWYGAEAVGKVVGMTKEKEAGAGSSGASGAAGAAGSSALAAAASGAKLEREQVLALLREDYDTSYFVSGKGDLAAYNPDCEFSFAFNFNLCRYISDPFVAFKGVDRFKQNVSNLGGMMEDIDLKITQWEETEDALVTSWRFSCVLDLPWRPKLAAAGGTTHVFDAATGRVVKHIERWDVSPKAVVQSLLLPSSKIPESKVEVFMFALSDGDALGMWLAASSPVLKFTAPWVAVSLFSKVAGISAEGTALGGVDNLAFFLLIFAGVGEVTRFFKGMIGS